MEELITRYIKSTESGLVECDYVSIGYINIDGANAEVSYYTDSSRHYKETTTINIWDMLIFINKLK